MRIKWLLFKQGFKSLFKYKSQFIIISLLSFLASFYLVSTLNVNDRINVLYNDVITENGTKYDYEYTKTIGSTDSLTSDSTDTYIMMDDFVNDQYVQKTDSLGNTATTSNYYITDDSQIIDGESHNSFVNEAFDSTAWKLSWKNAYYHDTYTDDEKNELKQSMKYYSAYGIFDSTGDYARDFELGVEFAKMAIDTDTGKNMYAPVNYQSANSINESLNMSVNNGYSKPYYLRRFIANTVGALMNSFTEKLDEYKNEINKIDTTVLPLAFQYYLKNTDAYNNWKKDFALVDYSNSDWQAKGWQRLFISMNNWKDTDYGKVLNSDKDFAYVYSAMSTIAFKMIDKMLTYEKQLWNNSGANDAVPSGDGQTLAQAKIDAYNEYYSNSENGPKVSLIDVSNGTTLDFDKYTEASKSHMNAVYSYLFGKQFTLDDDKNLHSTDDTYNLSNYYISQDSHYERTMKIGDENTTGIDSFDDFKYGLKGMLCPIIFSSSDGKTNSLSLEDDLSILGRYEESKSFSASRGGLFYEYDDIDVSSEYSEKQITQSKKSILTMEKYHQDMAAYLTNLNVSMREEGYLYDSSSKKSYRFVILDDNEIKKGNQYCKLIEGVEPQSENEILINEQYALKNNLSIGKSIKIGGVWKVITGYATDTLSYYPLVDISVSMPDVANGAVVYLSKQSLNNLGSNSDISSNLIMNNYNFISNTNNLSSSEYDKNVKIFNSLISTNVRHQDVSYDVINKKEKSQYWSDGWKNDSKLTDFEKTNWYLNWTIQPKFSNTLSLVTIIVTAIILLLTFIAIAFGIRKNIQANTSQIAYSKSMGIFSRELAFSYIGYSIFISFVIVPIAWIIAGFLQEYVVRMFIAYLATPLYQFSFSWKWLLLIIGVVGVTSFIVSIILAIYYNRKPIRQIINGSKVSKLHFKEKKNEKQSKLPFNVRFDIKIALRGKGSLISMVGTTFLMTILISALVFLPAAFNKYIDDSNKFFSYKNSYEINNDTSNIPLSSRSLDAWEGDDWLEENNSGDIFNDSDVEEYASNYYDNVADINASTSSTGLFSTYKLKNNSTYSELVNNVQWTSQYMDNQSESSDSSDTSEGFISLLLSSLIQKVANFNGFSLSMGDLEKLQVMPLYLNKNSSDKEYKSMAERIQQLSKTQSLIKDGIPQLIKTLLNVPDYPISDDWRKTIIYLIQSYVPGTYTNYLSNDTRVSQFSLGSGTETYVPGKETLSTSVSFSDDSNRTYTIDGLKDNQTVYNLAKTNTSNVFLDDETLTHIENLYKENSTDKTNDINYLSSKGLYNKTTKTLYVPTIVNKTVNDSFDFDSSVSLSSSKMVSNSKLIDTSKLKDSIVPKGAWIYDDRDYQSFKQGKDVKITDNSATLDPYSLQSSKFTYQYQYNKNSSGYTMNKSTSLFDNINQDENGNYSTEVRSYYNINNVRLYIPKALIKNDGVLSLAVNGNANTNSILNNGTSSDTDDVLSNQTKWADNSVSASEVPQSVKDAWNSKLTDKNKSFDEYVWIDPYNQNFSKAYNSAEKGEVSIQDIEKATLGNFGDSNIDIGSNSPFTIKNMENTNDYVNKVKLKKISILKTFNDGVIIADQDIVNTILGNSTSKFIVNNKYELDSSTKKTTDIGNGNTINTYDYSNININGEFEPYGLGTLFSSTSEAIKYDTQPIWYNKKFSQFSEATSITTQLRSQISGNTSFASAAKLQDLLKDISSPYSSVELASLKVGVIISISKILITVCVFAISGIMIIAFLYMMLIADAFVSNFARFIIIMKALGYTNKNIVRTVVNIQAIFSAIFFVIGVVISIFATKGILSIANVATGINVPFVIIWWTPIFIVGLIVLSNAIATATVLDKFLRVSPTKIFKE